MTTLNQKCPGNGWVGKGEISGNWKGPCHAITLIDIQILMMNFFKGGVATSFNVDKYGTFINDGVQGGSYSYRNTLLLHKVIMILRLFKYEYLMIRLLEVGFNINGLKFKT